MRNEIERTPTKSLEIVLIERFKKKLKAIRSAINSEDDDGDPNKSVITVQQDGKGLHYSNRESPTDRSEEFYVFEASETGELIACEFTEYEIDPDDNKIDIKRILRGQIRTRDGMLVQSINPQLIETALVNLSRIHEKAKTPAQKPISSDQIPLTLPLNPVVLH